MTLIDDLAAQAESGKLLLLLGGDSHQPHTGVPAARDLAHGLANMWQAPIDDSLARVAEPMKVKGDEWRYLGYLENTLANLNEPGALHTAVAATPIPYLLTTCYDNLLPEALKRNGRPANILATDDDLLNNRRSRRPDIIKINGSAQDSNALIVAEQEYFIAADRKQLFKLVRKWFEEKTALLIGCDPEPESDFTRLMFPQILKNHGAFDGDACLVWPQPTATAVEAWEQKGVTVVDADPLAFLGALSAALNNLNDDAVLETKDPLKTLANILLKQPPKAELINLMAQVPAEQHPKSVRITLRLRLEKNSLQSILNIDYNPDVTHYHSWCHDSQIPLANLQAWADRAALNQMGWRTPQADNDFLEQSQQLFDALLPFNSERRENYTNALRNARLINADVEIVLEFDDVSGPLLSIPWELLYDKQVAPKGVARGFVGMEYPLYRHPESLTSLEQVSGKIERALIVAVDPTRKLSILDKEVDELRKILEAHVKEVDVLREGDADLTSRAAIIDKLRNGRYQLFQFVGHGIFMPDDPAQSYVLVGSLNDNQRLTAVDLGRVAREGDLILVMLTACEVGLTAPNVGQQKRPWLEAGIVDALVSSGVPAALGMRWEVGENNAMQITTTFYKQLFTGKPISIQKALMAARQDIPDQPDWANPILTKRHGVLS